MAGPFLVSGAFRFLARQCGPCRLSCVLFLSVLSGVGRSFLLAGGWLPWLGRRRPVRRG